MATAGEADLDPGIVRASIDEPSLFADVFDGLHSELWSFMARRVGTELADELSGEVFVAAFESRGNFDHEKGSVRAWLYGIARNKMRMARRTEERRRRAVAREAQQHRTPPDPTGEAAEAVDLEERTRQVREALARLPDVDRELIELYAWERLSYLELAQVLGVPVGTVRSRLSRARAKLQDLLAGSAPHSGDTQELT